jgi:hypothetical protein
MLKKLRGRWTLPVLALLLLPAAVFAADYFSPGAPCHQERIIYYSDANYSAVVGGDEFICWQGHYVWGQSTNYWRYEYTGPCCEACCDGVCGGQP